MADSARKHQIDHEKLDPEAERGRKRPRGDDEGYHGLAIHNGHQKQLRHQDYKIGIICALELEMSAVRYMLDDEHIGLREVHGDPNSYIVGTLSGHNVVITCLPENQGKGAAAIVATNMARTFPGIELRLLVGIGGGVPSDKHDIRLGDVVIGMPEGLHSGVIQYDLGKDTGDGFIRKGYLSPAPSALRSAVVRMQSDHRTTPNRINGCKNCDREGMAHRFSRESSAPQIHYGLIASGDRVMRNARRTHLNAQSDLGDVLCFEMEAAGILTEFPCLVIRGISDYADSHKNDIWHHYAAASAAGCAKELLSYLGSGFSQDKTELDHSISPDYAAPASAKPAGISSRHRDEDNASISKEEKQKLLESLRFDQIESRKSNIKNSHTRTCKWLLGNPEYCGWLDSTELNGHHGVLWIKGKPGAGKSTLMKFALDNALEKMKDKTVLHFFFNARGEELEKSTIGMYRTLLWQLFKEIDPPAITARYKDKGFQWNVVLLQEAFKKAIQNLGQSDIMCFIDALDECEEMQIRDMLRFFEDMAELAVKAGIRFNVLFASRHYPHITIKKGLELTLEGQKGHSDDIVTYVDSELKIGDSNITTQIKNEVRRKASGIFMWVVLVIQILNKEYDRGRINTLWRKLQDIPGDLHDLFRDILTRDKDNGNELILCIQWVLFASRPLTPVELYCILLFETDCSATNEWNPENITDEAMKKYILDCSKGLAEITVSKPTVQFIHESVRDFLLKENWLSQIWPDLRDNFEGQSHEHLKRRCLEYMTMESISDFLNLDQVPSGARMWKMHGSPYGAAAAFPFLEYAISNVFDHAEAAAKTGIVQSAFLESFQISWWIALNVFEDDMIYQYGPYTSLQYVLADRGLLSLIEACSSSPSWLEKENEDERDRNSLFSCLANKSKDTLQAIMRAYARNGPPGSKLRELCNRALLLENQRVNPATNYERCWSPVLSAVANGHTEIAKLLLNNCRFHPDMKDDKGWTPLCHAAVYNHAEIVNLLLADQRVDPNITDIDGRTLLSWAAGNGHTEIFKLLFAAKRIDLNTQSADALSWAARNGRAEVIELLLGNEHVKSCIRDDEEKIIQEAWSYGKEIMTLILAEMRVGPNIQTPHGMTLLSWAAWNDDRDHMELLLKDQRVNPNIQDKEGRSALLLATERRSVKTLQLLLSDPRVDQTMQDKDGKTALSLAKEMDDEELVGLLQSACT
ncbi:hypothetical protein ASPVEDRAFT_122198 [Aspergillus versicolor CBS 583.65]|uniref:Uncharacterized protein n=1 Tax=Aspergillus versicolor CBS 583.65 TaxID=1036611 RepID=A0A1L9P7F3_ASPVE|nr:uncharacterized protein ASPVEDRAFT_122198 [Aspergillus versicolor CBS 583.65]OJI97354.1 hypothetical protein ASPVEDRAFT_122198 [Aspergillus versicolor CBS 583.65]